MFFIIQKQSPRGVKIEFLTIFTKFTGKHLCQSPFYNKVAGRTPFLPQYLFVSKTKITQIKPFIYIWNETILELFTSKKKLLMLVWNIRYILYILAQFQKLVNFLPYFSRWIIVPLHVKKWLSQLQFMLHLSVY